MATSVPPSFSSVGKMADISRRRDMGKVHRVQKAVTIRPWDGMQLIDNIMAEANASMAPEGSRGANMVSSPRVNPTLVEQEITETTETRMSAFLKSTASTLDELPAKGTGEAAEETASTANEEEESTSRPRKKVPKPGPSASFIAKARPPMSEEFGYRAPAVGKYTPKYTAVERHTSTPVITMNKGQPRAATPLADSAKRPPMRSPIPLDGAVGSPAMSEPPVDGSVSFGKTKSEDKQDLSSSKVIPATIRGQPVDKATNLRRAFNSQKKPIESHQYRKHDVRDASSAFKTKIKREWEPTSLDLNYHPFPDPGTTTYHRGKFRPGDRERDFKDPAGPCGPNIFYYVADKYEPRGAVPFSKIISRDDDKTHTIGHNATPAQSLEYKPNIDSLSTIKRKRSITPFEKQVTRPDPKRASSVEPVNLYFDSVLTRKKQGHVDMSRMVKQDIPYEDEVRKPPQPSDFVEVNRSQVETRAPSVNFNRSFAKAEMRQGEAAHVSHYSVNETSVRRHRPQCYFPRTNRESPIMRTAKHDHVNAVYETDKPAHVPKTDIGAQLSRDEREGRYAVRYAAADVVYDVPPPRPASTVPFSKLKGR